MPRYLSLALAAGLLVMRAASSFAAEPVPAPAPDTRLVTAADLQSVKDYFATKDVKFDRSASTSGNPILLEKDDAFRVSFFCGVGQQACAGQSYNTLILWACDDTGANRTAKMRRVYLAQYTPEVMLNPGTRQLRRNAVPLVLRGEQVTRG